VIALQDETTIDDQAIKTERLFDGLGRISEEQHYATFYRTDGTTCTYSSVKHTYDALSRTATVGNPTCGTDTPHDSDSAARQRDCFIEL
jgi:hypothetical protein